MRADGVASAYPSVQGTHRGPGSVPGVESESQAGTTPEKGDLTELYRQLYRELVSEIEDEFAIKFGPAPSSALTLGRLGNQEVAVLVLLDQLFAAQGV